MIDTFYSPGADARQEATPKMSKPHPPSESAPPVPDVQGEGFPVVPRSARERLAQQLFKTREARELTLRAVETKTAELEAQNPEMYQTVGYNSVRKYELPDGHPTASDLLRAEAGRVRALIQVYYGSIRHFIEVTGMDPRVSSADGEKAQPLTRVPLYLQNSTVLPRQIGEGGQADRHVILPAPVGDFALEIRGMSMSPALHEGQVAFARFGTDAVVGRLTVLYRRSRVELAYCIATRNGGVFATLEPARSAFTLDEHEHIFGWVTFTDPNVPAVNLGESEDVAHSA